MFLKKRIGLMHIIPASTHSLPVLSPSQDAAQPAAYPAVYRRERLRVAVFEVFKPAPRRHVHPGYDRLQAVAVASPRLLPDTLLELIQQKGSV